MKIKLAFLCLLSCLLLNSGCSTSAPTPQSIQNKAKGIAYLVTAESLLQHPNWQEHFEVASLEFQTLATSTNLGLAEITAILRELPVKELRGERAAIYITVGTLFLQDELGEVGVTNPTQLMHAARGIHEGIDLAVKLVK